MGSKVKKKNCLNIDYITKAFIYFVLLCLCMVLLSCGFSLPKDLAPLITSEKCPKTNVSEIVQKSKYYNRNTPITELECALSTLRKERPQEKDAALAGAKICYILADCSTHPDRMVLLASEGVRWAELGLKTEDQGALHYYFAVNLGIAVKDIIVAAIRNLSRLESSLKKACELSPEEDQGGPLRVLGMLYLHAPPWPQGIGDVEKARKYLKESVERFPQYPVNHLYYAKAIYEDEREDGISEIEKEIMIGLDLIEKEDFGCAEMIWREELLQLAKEAGLVLKSYNDR